MSVQKESLRPLRVLTILGTRPEAIKLAPLVMACREEPRIIHHLCTTGQHREMLDQVLDVFGLRPDTDLKLMRPGQDLVTLTADSLLGLRDVIKSFKPDWVLVQGDTTTALTGGLAAFYERVPVAHVEAGLRTGNIYSPWPEELNRRMLGSISSLHCAPTEWAARNLRNEGTPSNQILVTGNTVIDALRWVSVRPEAESALKGALGDKAEPILNSNRRVILVTGHRRENLDVGLSEMCTAVRQLAERGDVSVVFPVHLNPKVQHVVKAILGLVENVYLVNPMDYLSFVALLRRSYMVITDSGGLQEEAPGLGKPVLVTRDTTERPEAIEAGTARLVGTSAARLIAEAEELLDNESAYSKMSTANNPFGDGRAAGRILREILQRTSASSH